MKKVLFAVLPVILFALFFTGVRTVSAQSGYTWEMLLEGLKNIQGAKVEYRWWKVGDINLYTHSEDMTNPNTSGCVAKISYPIGMTLLDDLLGWPRGTVHSLGGLMSGNESGFNYNMVRVDNSYCYSGIGGGGKGQDTVPQFSMNHILIGFAALVFLFIIGALGKRAFAG